MGYQPIPIAVMPTSASRYLAIHERRLRRELRGRDSIWPWRRRRAYEACRSLIRALEAACDLAPDPWQLRAPPKSPRPLAPTYTIR